MAHYKLYTFFGNVKFTVKEFITWDLFIKEFIKCIANFRREIFQEKF